MCDSRFNDFWLLKYKISDIIQAYKWLIIYLTRETAKDVDSLNSTGPFNARNQTQAWVIFETPYEF